MTPKLLRELKAVNFSCTSPDSTSIHHESILITPGIGGRAIDRFSPHLRDPLRSKSFNSPLLPPRSDRNIDNSTTPNSKPKRNKKISEKKTTTVSASPANSQRYLLSSSTNSERFFFNTDEISSSSFTAEKNLPPSKFQYSEEIEESSEVFTTTKKIKNSKMPFMTLPSILFPPPPSLFVTAMSLISFTSLANAGLSEIRGIHMRYSKFWNLNAPSTNNKKDQNESSDANPRVNDSEISFSNRTGMFFLYAPAAVAAAASFFVPGAVVGLRSQLVSGALAVHFSKRVFEVLFIHQYSGKMLLSTAIPISTSYFLSTVTMIYAQYLSQGMPEPSIDLEYPGLVLFLISIAGNFYHHLLLSNLRKNDDKSYKIPRGGLFGLVICPHYLFEILGFVGISVIAQTVYAFSFTFGTACYLMGRSYATREWYLSKFDNFPRNVKNLIPYIF